MNLQNPVRFRETEEADLDYVLELEADADTARFIAPWPRDDHRSAITDPTVAHWVLEDTSVPRVRFPDATEEQEQALIGLLTREMPTWNIELSLDRLIPMLDLAEKQVLLSQGFDNSPPEILFREQPTVLVAIDGEPQLRAIPDSNMKAVVNTPFLIAQDPGNAGSYFLFAGADTWYRASAIQGPWAVTASVPREIQQLQPEEEEADPDEASDEGPSSRAGFLVESVSSARQHRAG